MAFVLLTFLVALAALLYIYLKNYYTYWEKRGVPHERPVFIFGNLYGIGRKYHFREINKRIYDRFKKSAPFTGMYLFVTKVAMIMDLDLAKRILIKDFSQFHDRGVFNNVRDDPITGHLLTLEGEEWQAMRHKLSPVFTSGKMKFMFPTVVAVAENLVSACGKMAATSGENVLEVKDLSARYTTDVIGTCAFGIECNSLQDPNAEFRQKGRDIFDSIGKVPIRTAFLFTNPDFARKLRMKLFPQYISKFFIDAVKRTVDYRIKHGVRRNDFMDMLIEMKAPDTNSNVSEDGIDLSQGLTLVQMAAQAFVFFVAGFDTSSTTMSFCLYELALNEEIQEKLRSEIITVLAKHNNEVTYEAMNEMTYLDQVLAETLRKYPVIPQIQRKATSDYPVPDTNFIIEKGTVVTIPIHAIHHDPEIYPKPEIFDPSRFEPKNVESRHSCAYLPFGDGPHNCIGLRFGKMQAKIGLILLLKNFEFMKSEQIEVPIVLSKKVFLTTIQNGIYLKVKRI